MISILAYTHKWYSKVYKPASEQVPLDTKWYNPGDVSVRGPSPAVTPSVCHRIAPYRIKPSIGIRLVTLWLGSPEISGRRLTDFVTSLEHNEGSSSFQTTPEQIFSQVETALYAYSAAVLMNLYLAYFSAILTHTSYLIRALVIPTQLPIFSTVANSNGGYQGDWIKRSFSFVVYYAPGVC